MKLMKMKKKSFMELRLSEAAEILKTIAADEKIKKEFIKFVDKVGSSSTIMIKEVLSVVTENVANALTNALNNKVNDVKQIVEGGNANVIGTTDDGSNSGKKDT